MSSKEGTLVTKALTVYSYAGIWILISGAVITYNKFLLAVAGFPYPIALTLWHMLFCSAIAIFLVRSNMIESINMEKSTYLKAIVPIGACYSITLWVGNAAYLYLSVSFIQMLKALMPVCVFSVGCLFCTEKFDMSIFLNMCMITLGVGIASMGELNFNLLGVLLQVGSIISESLRLVLVQLLLQSRGLKLNPITTLYYVAPCCFLFLLVPFFSLEWLKLVNDPEVVINPFYMITNAMVAFCLNMAVFLLIGKTSALTMNVAGVVKDWLLIGISVWIFHASVSVMNISGYLLAFSAVCWYNYQKIQRAKQVVTDVAATDDETTPMVPIQIEKR